MHAAFENCALVYKFLNHGYKYGNLASYYNKARAFRKVCRFFFRLDLCVRELNFNPAHTQEMCFSACMQLH